MNSISRPKDNGGELAANGIQVVENQERADVLIEDAAAVGTRAILDVIGIHLPDARAAFGFGSAFSGQAMLGSDADALVIVPSSRGLVNYAFNTESIKVDLLILGSNCIDRAIEYARATGVSTVVYAGGYGRTIFDPFGEAEILKVKLAEAYYAGPSAPRLEQIRQQRWLATSQLADVAQDRPSAEIRAAALTSFASLVQLHQMVSGTWRNRGKWIVRNDPDGKIEALLSGYDGLFARDEKRQFLKAAAAILNSAGGPLSEGKGIEMVFVRD